VVEMSNWAQANLNKGELDGTRILKTESYEALWDTTVNFTENTKIGLSWFTNNYHGLRIVSHGGGDLGYRSNITLVPERQLGIILASNYSGTPMTDIRDDVLAILLGYTYELPRLSVSMEIAEVFDKDGIDAAKTYYYKLKNESENNYSFSHWELNRLGYHYLGKAEYQKAIEIFKFNIELYPEEANTYDSLGEAYMAAGNIEKAIVNYEKSVELDSGNTNAIKMLKKLKGTK
jgi:hypothetical protein